MAGWPELEDRVPIKKAGTKMRRTLRNYRSLRTSDISLKTTEPMANSPHLPCFTLITLS